MVEKDYLTMIVVGAGFIILGLGGIFWGRHEEKSYFDSLAGRHDAREFVAHWPERPQLVAFKIGGWVALAIGVILLAVGIIFALTSSAAV